MRVAIRKLVEVRLEGVNCTDNQSTLKVPQRYFRVSERGARPESHVRVFSLETVERP